MEPQLDLKQYSNSLFQRQVIPMYIGWFAEINENPEQKTIKIMAQKAAIGDYGVTSAPLMNPDRKVGALPIILQCFSRAIGVAIVRRHINHNLGRMR